MNDAELWNECAPHGLLISLGDATTSPLRAAVERFAALARKGVREELAAAPAEPPEMLHHHACSVSSLDDPDDPPWLYLNTLLRNGGIVTGVYPSEGKWLVVVTCSAKVIEVAQAVWRKARDA